MTASNFATLDGVTLTVRFDDKETVTGVNASGWFSIYGGIDIPYGVYTVCVKEMRSLALCQENVVIPSTVPPVLFGDLISGDADGSNFIDILDFIVWKSQFHTHGVEGDFNNDGFVDLVDFSIWMNNFAQAGDPFPVEPLTSTQALTVSIVPRSTHVMVGAPFVLDLQVESGPDGVDGVQIYINFDPAYLQVVDEIVANDVGWNIVMSKTVDNTTGQIDYVAFALAEDPPTGTYDTASILFMAIQRGTTAITFNHAQPRETRIGGFSQANGNLISLNATVEVPVPPLDLDLGAESPIEAGETATLFAVVVWCGNPWAGDVTFTSSAGAVDSPVTTVNGVATTTLSGVTQVGTVVVTATASGVIDIAHVVVTHSSAELVDITPKNQTVMAKGSVVYTLDAFDAYSNAWDATNGASFDIEAGTGGSWAGNVYTSENAGTWIVTGSYESHFDTTNLTVRPYLAFDPDPEGGTVEVEPPQPPGGYEPGTVVTITATPTYCYEFVGWTGDLTGESNPATVTMTGYVVVTATFQQPTYTLDINVAPAGGGSVTLDSPSDVYSCGTLVTATAVPTDAWEFVGWSGDLTSSDETITLTMENNKVITATFSLREYVFLPVVLKDSHIRRQESTSHLP